MRVAGVCSATTLHVPCTQIARAGRPGWWCCPPSSASNGRWQMVPTGPACWLWEEKGACRCNTLGQNRHKPQDKQLLKKFMPLFVPPPPPTHISTPTPHHSHMMVDLWYMEKRTRASGIMSGEMASCEGSKDEGCGGEGV